MSGDIVWVGLQGELDLEMAIAVFGRTGKDLGIRGWNLISQVRKMNGKRETWRLEKR